MARKNSTIQGSKSPAVHTQTLIGEMTPAATSLTKELTQPRPGQPTKRTAKIVEEIASRLACGEALTMICMDAHMPGLRTVQTWQNEDPELRVLFNSAREEGAYVLDDVAELIARRIPGVSTGDYRYDDLLVSVLAQRKRYANRARFGDKQQVEVTHFDPIIIDTMVLKGPGGDGI
jgi:hypothetical protein